MGVIKCGTADVFNAFCGDHDITDVLCDETVICGDKRCYRVTDLTKVGSTAGRTRMAWLGDATSGIMFGGLSRNVRGTGGWYTYTVTDTTITFTQLSVRSTWAGHPNNTPPAIPTASEGGILSGTKTSGFFYAFATGLASDPFGWHQWRYTISGGTVSLTPLYVHNVGIRTPASWSQQHLQHVNDVQGRGTANGGFLPLISPHDINHPYVTNWAFYTMYVPQRAVSWVTRRGTLASRDVTPGAGDLEVNYVTPEGDTVPSRGRYGMVGDTTSGLIFGGDGEPNLRNDFITYIVSGHNVKLKVLNNRGYIPPMHGMGMVGDKNAGLIFGGLTGVNEDNRAFYRYDVDGDDVHITRMAGCNPFHQFANQGVYGGSVSSGFYYGGHNADAIKYAVEG